MARSVIGRQTAGREKKTHRRKVQIERGFVCAKADRSEKVPVLKENELMASGIVRRSDAAMTERAAAESGRVRMDGRRVKHEMVLEKPLVIDGEEYKVQGRTPLDLKENERLLRQQLEISAREDPTLNQYFQEWIFHREKTANKAATPYRYKMFYQNHIANTIGRKRIRDLRRRDILQLQTDMLKRVSPVTANYMLQLLKQILNEAEADELIEKNPAKLVKRLAVPGNTAAGTSHRALTVEEQQAFLDAVSDTFYAEFFTFLLLTGLRQGECAALTWGDIDRSSNVIHVRSTLTFDKAGHVIIGPPKSAAGERDIPMNDAIRDVLLRQEHRLIREWGRRSVAAQRLVFPSSTGRILHNATANKAVARALRRLEEEGRHIDHFSVHALRDTFATRFIERGGTPQTLKSLLGHASIKMTMDLYAQVLPNTKQREMDAVRILGEE